MAAVAPSPKDRAEIFCRNVDGRVMAVVEIAPIDPPSKLFPETAPLVEASRQQAREQGETEIQLRENGRYEYRLRATDSTAHLTLTGNRDVISPSRLRDKDEVGRIETGSHCGLLRLEVEDLDHRGSLVAVGYVEVRSVKLNYRDEYRRMLDYIAVQASAMLFDSRATAQMPLAPKWTSDPVPLQQQIEFLRETMNSPHFYAAMRRIETFPHQALQSISEERDVCRPFRPGRAFVRQVASASNRVRLPESHPLCSRLSSLPGRVVIERKRDMVDTPENRFVKHVVTSFRAFIQHALKILRFQKTGNWQRVIDSAEVITAKLEEILSWDFFRDISPMRMLPLNSPVLQRKAGYRELLQIWQRFSNNSRLHWRGGEDVYHAGKRNVAALYEYWLFFQLLHWFCGKFSPAGKKPTAKMLFDTKGSPLVLNLQRGMHLGPFDGIYSKNHRRVKAQFHYNRRFEFVNGRGNPGSWTRPMHPDYTLTFWPADFETVEEAEEQELAVHIHFDAKYRVESVDALFGGEKDAADADDTDRSIGGRGNYKRADLLKMHAYRDAIRRSEGAYILYPGSDNDRKGQVSGKNRFQGFHEILPGLGAFALSPGEDGKCKGIDDLNSFIDNVIEHLGNPSTRREQVTYHRYAAYDEAERLNEVVPPPLLKSIPEQTDGAIRVSPPAEHLILLAEYRNHDHLVWIKENGKLAIEIGNQEDHSLLLSEVFSAQHLLLHIAGLDFEPGLFKITSNSLSIHTADELSARGIPKTGEGNIYAVFDVASDPSYSDWAWDRAELCAAINEFRSRKRKSINEAERIFSRPEILSLRELMRAVK